MVIESATLHRIDDSWGSALTLVRLSQLVYNRDLEAVRRMLLERSGFTGCSIIDNRNIEGLVAWDHRAVAVVYRGTTSLLDWLTDLNTDHTQRPYGSVHTGFYEAFQLIRKPVEQALEKADAQGKRIWLTGHSLGGALALVTLAELHANLPEPALRTFGQPMALNSVAARFVDSLSASVLRYVNNDDIIPRVPPFFQHAGREIQFGRNGEPREKIVGAEASEREEEFTRPMGLEEFRRLQADLRSIRDMRLKQKPAETDIDPDMDIEGFIPGFSGHRINEYVRLILRQNRLQPRSGETRGAVLEPYLLEQAARSGKIAADLANLPPDIEAGFPTEAELEETFGAETPIGAEELQPEAQALPVLIELRTPDWQAPAGVQVQSKIGHIVSAMASSSGLAALDEDELVVSVEPSRKGGVFELAQSLPFVHADQVLSPPVGEKGDQALVGIIDSGIDVLHNAFLDANGNTRFHYIWDQRTQTAGASPNARNPAFAQNYGTLYDQHDIQAMINHGAQVPYNLRDPHQHGTHVTSIAAGRATGSFNGGLAPEARLVVVIPSFDVATGDPLSLGYSNSHVDALAFIKAAAQEIGLPVAVNVSLGMNAGAHDGSSLLEAAFDNFTGEGRQPGLVLVKSAGNERGHAGHARADVAQGAVTEITWESSMAPRDDDYFEFWFSAFDELEFTLFDPAGNATPPVSAGNPHVGINLDGNECELLLTTTHRDNGDSLLQLTIRQKSDPIRSGIWKLEILGQAILGDGVVHGWVERDHARAVRFRTGDNDEMTLSIPGTARHIITVAACEAAFPVRLTSSSSWGLTRDQRPKPDIAAPGKAIVAARGATANHSDVVAMTGTSMAAPHVTGSIALVLSKRHKNPAQPQVNANQVRSALTKTAQNFSGRHNRGVGFGVLDTLAFFNYF